MPPGSTDDQGALGADTSLHSACIIPDPLHPRGRHREVKPQSWSEVCHIRTSPVPPPISAAPRTGPRAGCSASGSKVPAAPQLKPTAAGVSKGQAKGPEVPGRKYQAGSVGGACAGWVGGCCPRACSCPAVRLGVRRARLPSCLPAPHFCSHLSPTSLLLPPPCLSGILPPPPRGVLHSPPTAVSQGTRHSGSRVGPATAMPQQVSDSRADAWWRERLCTAVLSARGWQSRWGQGCCHTSQCPDPFPPTHQVPLAE